jgi:hypothetical protein
MNRIESRRRFIKIALVAAGSAPLGAALVARPARAADLPQLSESDPTAAALGYKHDTTKVDGTKYPNHKAEQMCSNCNLIQSAEGAWRPCSLFPGKGVAEKGWCAAYVKKA